MVDKTDSELLLQIAGIHGAPQGAHNIRKNGKLDTRLSTTHIVIESKNDGSGIDITVLPGTTGESVHIPVLITATGHKEMVANDFFIGAAADVDIIAGCGIHNCGAGDAQHDGIHTFHIGKGARVRYVEKHYGSGEGGGARIMNPQTVVYLEEGASMTMETTQIKGVNSTRRYTKATCAAGSELVITEKLLTHDNQIAESEMDVFLEGDGAKARIISRSVAQDDSVQIFYPRVQGSATCFGHVQCDAILMDNAKIKAIPAIAAEHLGAQLIHEAAIGRIAGDQISKLMTLGLTMEEAEEKILNGFLQ